MSRGDEIQADEPYPPRRTREDAAARWGDPDDDDIALARPRRSGLVTAVGVIAIVFGCWVLLGSLCLSVYPVLMNSVLDLAAQQNPNDAQLRKAREDINRMLPM